MSGIKRKIKPAKRVYQTRLITNTYGLKWVGCVYYAAKERIQQLGLHRETDADRQFFAEKQRRECAGLST